MSLIFLKVKFNFINLKKRFKKPQNLEYFWVHMSEYNQKSLKI